MDHEAGVLRILQAEEGEVMEILYVVAIAIALALVAFCTSDNDDDDWRGHA